MFRVLGLGTALLAAASTGMAGEHYVEVWNPPEARVSMPHRALVVPRVVPPVAPRVIPPVTSLAARLPTGSRHTVAHTVKTRARHAPASAAGLVARAERHDSVPAHTPDMSEIPRQITPEGNVLRVASRGLRPEVAR